MFMEAWFLPTAMRFNHNDQFMAERSEGGLDTRSFDDFDVCLYLRYVPLQSNRRHADQREWRQRFNEVALTRAYVPSRWSFIERCNNKERYARINRFYFRYRSRVKVIRGRYDACKIHYVSSGVYLAALATIKNSIKTIYMIEWDRSEGLSEFGINFRLDVNSSKNIIFPRFQARSSFRCIKLS